MKQLTTLLIAAAFSTPVFAASAIDFDRGIENGYQSGPGSFVTASRSGPVSFAGDHVLNFDQAIDEGWGGQGEYRGAEVLLSDQRGSGNDRLDFGIGIESGYKGCVC